MSLANLQIDVSVNTGQAQRGLRDIGATAQEQFMRSGAAVDDFRADIMAASDALERAARSMGSGMDRAAQQITAASAKSEKAISEITKSANDADFDSFGEKVAVALGAGFGTAYAATEEWMQKTEDFVVAKGKAIAIGVALTAAAAGAGALYAAYRLISGSADFIKGLFTGDSYKSASIDSLTELNRQVETLQKELQISAQHAHALLDATARLGVDPKDYSETYRNVTKAVRENADELDRLGVQYKAADGKVLDNRTVLENAKKVLDTYVQGYDRLKAAQAIGIGSEEQIAAALKVTRAEIQASKARLDDYNLALGADAQKAIARYQAAMREFNSETAKMSAGIQRVMADALMPALTDLAEFFRDGWPSIVNGFRIGVSSMVAIGYILKDGIYVISESILGSLQSIGIAFGSLAEAAYKAMQGRLTDAKDVLVNGMEAAYERFKRIGANIEAQVMHNDAAIRMAVGADDRKKSIEKADASLPGNSGTTTWTKKGHDGQRGAYDAYIEQLQRMLKKQEESEYAAMRLQAAQAAHTQGVKDYGQALQLIQEIERADGDNAVTEIAQRRYQAANAYAAETQMLGKNALEQEKLKAAKREMLEVDRLIDERRKSRRPLDEKTVKELMENTAAYVKHTQDLIDARDAKSRTFDTGVSAALNNYVRSATDAAANVTSLINGALQRSEDAFINWAKTGKLSAKDLFGFMAEEYLRQTFRMAAAKMMPGGGGFGSLSDIFEGIGMLFGGSMHSLANGIDYVPYNGFPTVLHEGEKVLTRQDAQAARSGGAGGGSVSVGAGQVIQIGQGVSRAEVISAINAANRQSEARIQRGLRQGSFA